MGHVYEQDSFYVTHEIIDSVGQQLAECDKEYAVILFNFLESRNLLAKARIARGFYPVVVPADDGPQPRYGRDKKGNKGGVRGRTGRRPRGGRTDGRGGGITSGPISSVVPPPQVVVHSFASNVVRKDT